MNQKINKSSTVTTEKGPVWNIKVGVFTHIANKFQTWVGETKLWKIKVILN